MAKKASYLMRGTLAALLGVDVARRYSDYELEVAADVPAGVSILQPKPDYASA